MKSGNRSVILVVLLGVAIISVSFVAINSGEKHDTDYPLPVTDALGRQIVFEEVPETIVSTAPATTEMVYAMGLGDRVIGVTDYCNWPTQVVLEKENGTLASVGEYWNPSLETIINLDPDLVVLSGGTPSHAKIAEQLGNMGIRSLVTWRGENLIEIYQNIEMLGEVCDCQNEAASLIQSMEDRVEYVRGKVAGLGPTKVLHAVWLNPVFTCGGETFTSQIIALAGGENIFASLTGWPTVSIEEIIAQGPEVMTITATGMGSAPEEMIQILEDDPLWSQVPAVQNEKVYILLDKGEDIFSRQSVRIIDALEIMAGILYPDVFGVTVPHVIDSDYHDYLVSGISETDAATTIQSKAAYV